MLVRGVRYVCFCMYFTEVVCCRLGVWRNAVVCGVFTKVCVLCVYAGVRAGFGDFFIWHSVFHSPFSVMFCPTVPLGARCFTHLCVSVYS